MIHWLRFFLRAGFAAFALWRTRHIALFFYYFTAHLGDTVAEEIAFQFFGVESIPYFWTYAIGSCLICLFALWIAVDSVPSPRRMRKMAIPLILAVPIAHKFQLECGSVNRGTWLLLAVGAILFFCGMVTSAAAVYSHQNHTALLSLGLLWLAQAMYFFGYLIHAPEWTATGYWLPALLACAGFLGVALTVPRPALPASRSGLH